MVFKKELNFCISVILIICIIAGYAGIPLSTMICKKDGHTSMSVLKKAEGCKHHAKKLIKACCDTINTDEKKDSGCCNFNHSYLKIYTQTLTQKIKHNTGHTLTSKTCLHPSCPENKYYATPTGSMLHAQPPPEWQIQRNKPAFTRIFLI